MDGAVTNGLYNRKQDRRHDKDQGSHLHYHSQAQQQNIDDQHNDHRVISDAVDTVGNEHRNLQICHQPSEGR